MAKSDKNNAKQQIIDKIRDVDTVLVAVNSNPSVDELSAAMGVTLALNKIGKHATSVFSGEVPMAIEFLEPGKTFENTVDSLRDFIIALDKEKADHLRYKVEGEMVKIFITPYRTTIDERDLEFSQGDYNVEMVLAIGVRNSDDLDRALVDHGRIMHDATVAGISIGGDNSEIGSITWHDDEASSYSELLADLVVKMRSDKEVLDEQISTALLTGIVAATERFSNERTSSGAMTMSAQLMAAGANQQLIASKLEEADELAQPTGIGMEAVTAGRESDDSNEAERTNNDGSTNLADGKSTKIDRSEQADHDKSAEQEKSDKPEGPIEDRQAPDGTMKISRERRGDLDEVSEQVERERQAAAARHAEEILAQGLPQQSAPAPGLSVADLQNDLKKAAEEVNADAAQAGPGGQPPAEAPAALPPPAPAEPAPVPQPQPQPQPQPTAAPQPEVGGFIETPLVPPEPPAASTRAESAPAFGGTLNATSEQAAADKRREQELDRNKTILSHGDGAASATPEVVDTQSLGGPPVVSSRGHDLQPLNPPEESPIFQALSSPQPTPSTGQTLAELDDQHREQPAASAAASDAMAEALSMANSTDQQQQQVPDVASLPPLPSAPQTADPSVGGLPPLPPMPDFSALPPLPPSPEPQMPTVSPQNQGPLPPQSPAGPPPAPQPNDPAAFQIPGQ